MFWITFLFNKFFKFKKQWLALSEANVSKELSVKINLRDSKRETTITTPPVVRIAIERVQPPTIAVAIRAEQSRSTVRIIDWLVHNNDPQETHSFDFLI